MIAVMYTLPDARCRHDELTWETLDAETLRERRATSLVADVDAGHCLRASASHDAYRRVMAAMSPKSRRRHRRDAEPRR